MTGAQMITEWRLGFDVIASNAAPGFTDSEIYSLLNRGQDYVILDLYKQKELKLLQGLIKEDSITLFLYDVAQKIYTGSLPGDYWLSYTYNVFLTRTPITTTGFIPSHEEVTPVRMGCDIISHEEALQLLSSSFNSLRIWKNPKAYYESNGIYVLADDYTTILTADDSNLVYVKKRADISNATTCELQESLHRLVVDKAIDIAKTIITIQEPQSTSK